MYNKEMLSLLEGDCMCYNAIMLPHTIVNIIA